MLVPTVSFQLKCPVQVQIRKPWYQISYIAIARKPLWAIHRRSNTRANVYFIIQASSSDDISLHLVSYVYLQTVANLLPMSQAAEEEPRKRQVLPILTSNGQQEASRPHSPQHSS